MAAVAFNIDIGEIGADLADIERVLASSEWKRAAADEIGALVTTRIARRTSQGRDYKGNAFTPYSEDYAEYRVENGRNASPVNLSWTGKMLNSLDYVGLPDGTVVLFFNVAERGQIAWYHNATLAEDPRPRTKMPLRRFVDLDPDGPDAERARAILIEHIQRQLG